MHSLWSKTTLMTPLGIRSLDAKTVSTWLINQKLKITYNYKHNCWKITNSIIRKEQWDILERELYREFLKEQNKDNFFCWDEHTLVIGLLFVLNILYWGFIFWSLYYEKQS